MKISARSLTIKALAVSLLCVSQPSLATTTIENADNGLDIGSFGRPDTATYGQVFVAPVTGVLTSFTFWLNGPIQSVSGGVGTWNDTDNFYNAGNGSPNNLFLGAPQTANGATIFSSNANVVAGQRYVAYMTTFGNSGPSGSTSIDRGTAAPNLNYFVWNNSSNPAGNANWNYFADFGNARFSANFSPASAVPEPATWAMMILGFGFVGGAMRRRNRQRTKVQYAF